MNETGRVEAFSDGVFAIAITLLVLEIDVPHVDGGESLWSALGDQWPSYLAYVVSFLVIGIMWANHHTVFGYLARVDRVLVFCNLLLLLVIAALPWPTALVAEYLDTGGRQAEVAIAVYCGFMVAHAATFQLFWWYVTRTGRLFHAWVDPEGARATRARFALGSVAYPVSFGLAFVAPLATVVLLGLLAVYYAFNQVAVPSRAEREQDAVPEQGGAR